MLVSSVYLTPCCAGKYPDISVERAGEHIHAFVKAFSNVRPCCCRRCRPGMLRSVQPGGKCWTARCWSVRKTSPFMPATSRPAGARLARASAPAAAEPAPIRTPAPTAALFSRSPRVMPGCPASVSRSSSELLILRRCFLWPVSRRHRLCDASEDSDGVAAERRGVDVPTVGTDSDRARAAQSSSKQAAGGLLPQQASGRARLLRHGPRIRVAIEDVERP